MHKARLALSHIPDLQASAGCGEPSGEGMRSQQGCRSAWQIVRHQGYLESCTDSDTIHIKLPHSQKEDEEAAHVQADLQGGVEAW